MIGLYVLGGLIFAIAVVIILLISDKKKKRKKERMYREVMGRARQIGTVNAMKEAKDLYKKGSLEYEALDTALDYLDRSIMRDFETAFYIIEKVFQSKETERLHAELMAYEKENAVRLLAVSSESRRK